MKKLKAYLIISVFIFSFTAFGQSQEIKDSSSKSSETKFELQRTILLEKDSKPEIVTIPIRLKTQRLELMINSSVTTGKLKIELYDPNDKKQGNFTVGTQLNSEKKELINGKIQKSLKEPKSGNWKVKIIPSDATGSVRIQILIFE